MGFSFKAPKISAPKISAPKISVPSIKSTVGQGLSLYGNMVDPFGLGVSNLTNMGAGMLSGAAGSGGGSIDPYSGQPIGPGFESMRDPTTGLLQDKYKYDPTKSAAFKQIQGQAMSTAPSAWANMQTQRQQLEQQGLKDSAAKQNLSALSQGQSQLARTGGLSSGAAALMARSGAKDMMMRNQEINRGGMLDRLGIGQQDEQTRQGLLRDVATAETGAEKANLMALMGDVEGKRNFDLNKYQQMMSAWGAGKSADAQLAAAQPKKQSGIGSLPLIGGLFG